MSIEAMDARVRALEISTYAHERVCSERYTAIVTGQGLVREDIKREQAWTNKLIYMALSLLTAALGAAAAGNPVVQLLSRIFA